MPPSNFELYSGLTKVVLKLTSLCLVKSFKALAASRPRILTVIENVHFVMGLEVLSGLLLISDMVACQRPAFVVVTGSV